MNKMLGQVAYEAYYSAIGGHATGRHWDMISPDERAAWIAVGQAVASGVSALVVPNSAGPDNPAFTGNMLRNP